MGPDVPAEAVAWVGPTQMACQWSRSGDTAQGNRPGSVRSYAYALLRWWRCAVGVKWGTPIPAGACDLVLWLKQASKPRLTVWTQSVATAGKVNPITRK